MHLTLQFTFHIKLSKGSICCCYAFPKLLIIVAQLNFRYSSNSFYINIKQKCDNEIINTILLTLNYKYTV